MPLWTTTSSRDVKFATAATPPVASLPRTKPGVFSSTTSTLPAPSSAAATGRPRRVATTAGVPGASPAPATIVRSRPRALSGTSTVAPWAPRPSTPCVGDDVEPSCSQGENARVAGSSRSTRLGTCWATKSLPSARTTMPSGPFASAIVRSTFPDAPSSTRRPPSRSLNQSDPEGVTATSSGSPLTRASTGRVLSAAAGGHPFSDADADADAIGVCVASAVPLVCDGELVAGAHPAASRLTTHSAPRRVCIRTRSRAAPTTARVSGGLALPLRLAPQRAANAFEIRQAAALALELREVLIAHQPADVSPQLHPLAVARDLDDDRPEDGRAHAGVENDCGNAEGVVRAHHVVVLALHLGPRGRVVERTLAERAVRAGFEQSSVDYRVVVGALTAFVDRCPECGVEPSHCRVAVRVTERYRRAQRRRAFARRCCAALVTLVG